MNLVCNGACANCTFGTVQSDLMILPAKRVNACGQPAATIADNIPIANIHPFVMCTSPANPAVQAVIIASLGTVTQAPCVPAVVAPWVTGKPDVLIGEIPALNDQSKAFCIWGGVISISFAGQVKVKL
ncbi:DUF4280 domain-containing protein [Candidatus Cytomitobacter indipagum]|uniref:DUF4280 domain-containing protein n=1 Tax=Candidatus Cytomitobacter indipagum TaxID=2601575 RepID=A0A5C0UEL6_9PROT|nr:DUF4280 domain-containing protein [Candidatus Cytomitobacter indipagum]QEK38209.1 DUF4280 domain-containing protein [Candidatus Cytomitobacter indipagum]